MGCDIHSYAERRVDGQWVFFDDPQFGTTEYPDMGPFEWRNYSVFAFLADVRNYSDIVPISPRRGLPGDVSAHVKDEYEMWAGDAHSCSWLSVKELVEFNYDQVMEDRRVMIDGDGGRTAEPGGGETMTYRQFLRDGFFDDLKILTKIGAERVVFWFDN